MRRIDRLGIEDRFKRDTVTRSVILVLQFLEPTVQQSANLFGAENTMLDDNRVLNSRHRLGAGKSQESDARLEEFAPPLGRQWWR